MGQHSLTGEQTVRLGHSVWKEGSRVSFYSWLPAGHNKSTGYPAHISFELALYYVPNLVFVINTLGKGVVFQTVC